MFIYIPNRANTTQTMSDCLFTYYDAEAVGGLCFELFLILLVVLFFQWADRGNNKNVLLKRHHLNFNNGEV